MTKYQLRDKEKQQALEKAFPGFSDLLQEGCAQNFGTTSTDVLVMSNSESVVDLWEISIPKVWIDKIEEYDPDKWNSPDVIPPEGIQMRVEWMDRYGDLRHSGAAFREGRWIDSDSKYVRIERVSRFRPWE